MICELLRQTIEHNFIPYSTFTPIFWENIHISLIFKISVMMVLSIYEETQFLFVWRTPNLIGSFIVFVTFSLIVAWKKRSHLLLLPFQSKVLKKFGYVNWSVIFFFLFWSPSNFTCTSICSQCMAKDNASIIDGNSFKWKNFRCCGCPTVYNFISLNFYVLQSCLQLVSETDC